MSTTNEARWNKFREDPEFKYAASLIRLVVEHAGLSSADLGQTWGVTVHVDKNTYVRINHGDYALFDIRDPHLALDSREFCMAVVIPADFKPGAVTRAKMAVTGSDLDINPGFEKKVPGSKVLWSDVFALPWLLNEKGIQRGLRDHVVARHRSLQRDSYHNPLTTKLFDR